MIKKILLPAVVVLAIISLITVVVLNRFGLWNAYSVVLLILGLTTTMILVFYKLELFPFSRTQVHEVVQELEEPEVLKGPEAKVLKTPTTPPPPPTTTPKKVNPYLTDL